LTGESYPVLLFPFLQDLVARLSGVSFNLNKSAAAMRFGRASSFALDRTIGRQLFGNADVLV
jgi:hypothetical protein